MGRLLAVGVLVVLAVSVAVLTGGASAIATDDGSSDPATTDSLNGAQEFDRTQFRIRVFENGSARFAIRYERQLSNESERERFRAFADEFESNETRLYTDFVTRAENLVAFGRNETGRSMTATAFRRSATEEPTFDGHVGIVDMSFQWSAFARTPDDRVVVDDVFEGGFYVGPSQSLVFLPGEGLEFANVSPEGEFSAPEPARSDSVTWQGERSFSDQRPRVVLVPASGTTATTAPTDGGSTTSPPDGTTATTRASADDGGSIPMLPLMVGIVLVGTAGAVVWLRSRDGDAPPDAPADDGPATTEGGSEVTATTDSAIADEELLTDEDRVVDLLTQNDGRMRQSNIVDETDWSKSKVSMLLSEMEDDGSISKLRVGRENIVSLAGQEPAAAGSPFETDDDGDDGEGHDER